MITATWTRDWALLGIWEVLTFCQNRTSLVYRRVLQRQITFLLHYLRPLHRAVSLSLHRNSVYLHEKHVFYKRRIPTSGIRMWSLDTNFASRDDRFAWCRRKTTFISPVLSEIASFYFLYFSGWWTYNIFQNYRIDSKTRIYMCLRSFSFATLICRLPGFHLVSASTTQPLLFCTFFFPFGSDHKERISK